MGVKRVMLSINEELLEMIDLEAKKKYQSRSEFVRDALRGVMTEEAVRRWHEQKEKANEE